MKKFIFSVLSVFMFAGCFENAGQSEQVNKQPKVENVRKEFLYYESGEIKEMRIYSNETGKPSGKWEFYNKNGEIWGGGNYVDGIKQGMWGDETAEGRRKIGNYISGKKNGERKIYHYDGRLWVVGTYKDDKLNGERKEYDNDGTLWTAGTYKDDKLNGKLERYSKGKLQSVQVYKDGEHGEFWKSAGEQWCGRLELTKDYRDGKLYEKLEVYDNGKLTDTVNFIDGEWVN